jgi:hypothetical protein
MKSFGVVVFDNGEAWVNCDGVAAEAVAPETAVKMLARWLGLELPIAADPRRPVAAGMVRIETAVGVHEFPAIQIAPPAAEVPAALDGSADCGHDVAG